MLKHISSFSNNTKWTEPILLLMQRTTTNDIINSIHTCFRMLSCLQCRKTEWISKTFRVEKKGKLKRKIKLIGILLDWTCSNFSLRLPETKWKC